MINQFEVFDLEYNFQFYNNQSINWEAFCNYINLYKQHYKWVKIKRVIIPWIRIKNIIIIMVAKDIQLSYLIKNKETNIWKESLEPKEEEENSIKKKLLKSKSNKKNNKNRNERLIEDKNSEKPNNYSLSFNRIIKKMMTSFRRRKSF